MSLSLRDDVLIARALEHDEDAWSALDESGESRGVPAPRELDRLDRRRVTQAGAVGSRAQRRRLRPLIDQRHRQSADFGRNGAARRGSGRSKEGSRA